MIGGKSVPEWSFVHPIKHVFVWNFLMKPVSYLFSGPNSLYGAFECKIDPKENFAQFCLESPLEFVFPKNTFSGWIFVLNRISPIFLAEWTRWHDWGDGNQGGSSLKDPLQVPDGPITRSRAKKIKEAMQGLVQSTWDEASKSPTIKVGLKEGEPILIHLIQVVEDMT